MNKKEIIKKLNEYDFDKDEYIVLASSALVLHGIKEKTNDIDLAVSPKLYEQLLNKYDCKEKDGYYNFDKFDFGLTYFDSSKTFIDDIPVQAVSEILNFKNKLNREKDKEDIELIKKYQNNLDKNALVLAYLGDAIYEVYIRKYLIDKGISKVNDLQSESVEYVSAKAQSTFLDNMIKDNFLTDEELSIVKRARNHKSHSNKSTDIVTYKKATGLEALIGYLNYQNKHKRINEIMNYIVGD